MRNKLGQFVKGDIPWNKGKEEDIPWNKGKKSSEETRKKQSIARKGQWTGSKNPRWKPKIIKTCKFCQKVYEIVPCKKERNQYCSKECMYKGFRNQKRIRKEISRFNNYIYIWCPEHPTRKNRKDKYVKRSHLVMEKYLGRLLESTEIVHHQGINYPLGSIENKQDDQIKNLILFLSNSAHAKYHALLKRLNK